MQRSLRGSKLGWMMALALGGVVAGIALPRMTDVPVANADEDADKDAANVAAEIDAAFEVVKSKKRKVKGIYHFLHAVVMYNAAEAAATSKDKEGANVALVLRDEAHAALVRFDALNPGRTVKKESTDRARQRDAAKAAKKIRFDALAPFIEAAAAKAPDPEALFDAETWKTAAQPAK